MANNIILGTAKFGIQGYGFSSSGRRSTCDDILDLSYENGIKTLDTSPRYGNAEKIIGDYHIKSKRHFKVCTKVDNLSARSLESKRHIYNSVERSVRRTKVERIETLYLHQNEVDIISDKAIMHALQKVKDDRLVEKVGVSIYSKEECEFALNSDLYDVIQLPVSILDSFIYSELIGHYSVSKEIIARSVFLQGTLFNRDKIKSQVKQSKDMLKYFSKLDQLALEYKVDLFIIACVFVLSLSGVSGMIVGTAVKENLLRVINASKFTIPTKLAVEINQLSSEYKEWGNPRNWQ